MSCVTREHLFEILEGRSLHGPGRFFAPGIVTLIVLNVLAVMLDTVESFARTYGNYLWAFEVASLLVFSVEYALRLWSCTASRDFAGGVQGRLRFALTPLAMVDLLAILPFYLPFVASFDLVVLRALRLFRFVRLFKLGRYSESVRTLGNVLRAKKEDLAITLGGVGVLAVTASTLMYFVEHDAQPEKFSSIPASMWWAVVTLTTVGYGDVYPVTPLGEMLAGLIAFLGIGLFALPAGILGSGFLEEALKSRTPKVCPHCGNKIS